MNTNPLHSVFPALVQPPLASPPTRIAPAALGSLRASGIAWHSKPQFD